MGMIGDNNKMGRINSPSLRGVGGVSNFGWITKSYLESNNILTENLIFSKKFLPYNPSLKQNSRELRKAGNLSEVILWKYLKADYFLGYSFNRQKPILNYIADFYCKELNLVIEIDGSSHYSEEAMLYDQERDRQMACLGLTVVRIADGDVKQQIDNVLAILMGAYSP